MKYGNVTWVWWYCL